MINSVALSVARNQECQSGIHFAEMAVQSNTFITKHLGPSKYFTLHFTLLRGLHTISLTIEQAKDIQQNKSLFNINSRDN